MTDELKNGGNINEAYDSIGEDQSMGYRNEDDGHSEAKRSYPCDDEYVGNEADGVADGAELEPVKPKGKGKRGGNAAFSRVIHSGKNRFGNRRDSESGNRISDDFGEREDDRYRDHGESRYSDRGGDGYSERERGGFGGRIENGYRGRGDDRYRDHGESRYSDRGGDRYGERERGISADRRGDRYSDRRGDRYSDRGGNRYSDRGDSEHGNRRRDGFGSQRENRSTDMRRGNDSHFNEGRRPAVESTLSKAYEVIVEGTSEIGAFVKAPEAVIGGNYGNIISQNVLLPFAEQIGRPEKGERITVRFYEDKGGRLTCTMRTPYLNDGEVGRLKVAAVTNIGAFLDNGVPKQVLLPFKEQVVSPEVGDEVLVWMYTDKSGRQAASMRVYSHLSKHSPYKEDDRVTGFVYEINPKLGVFVAVDDKYYGLVPIQEIFISCEYGDEVEARVAKVREDGKLDLLVRDKLYKTVNEDADVILYELRRCGGFLPYGDRADPRFIENTYAMSKNQFKRALGHLYKNHIVELDRENDTVTLIKTENG